MSLEFLRVISGILLDVAQAIASAMAEIAGLMKLSPAQAKKLKAASGEEINDVSGVLGSTFDRVSRSLMAVLERWAPKMRLVAPRLCCTSWWPCTASPTRGDCQWTLGRLSLVS